MCSFQFRARTAAIPLKQVVNRRWIIQNMDRPAGGIEQLQARVDAKDAVDGGVDVGGNHGAGVGAGAEAVGGAVDLSTLDAAATEQAEHGIAPVIAAGSAHAA